MHFNEDIFRESFEQSSNGVAIISPEGEWLKVNDSFCKITGYSEEELLATDIQSITHPDDIQISQKLISDMLSGQHIPFFQIEKRYIHKLGHIVWVMISSNLYYDSFNQPSYMISQIIDITRYKCSENELIAARRDLEDTVRMQQGMTVKFKKINGRYIHSLCDGELLYRLGLRPVDVVGKELKDFYPPSISARKESYYHRVWEGEENVVYEGEWNGIAYMASLRPIKQNGEVVEVIASCVDITERKVFEQRYSSLFEYHPDAIVSCDLDGRVLSCNPACRTIMGYRLEEPLPHWVKDFFQQEDWEQLADSLRNMPYGKPSHFQLGAIHKSGERIELAITGVPLVVNHEVVGLHLILQDVTEQKRMQEELLSTKELLESFFKHIDEAIILFDLCGKILKANKAFETIFGWKLQEVVGDRQPKIIKTCLETLLELAHEVKGGKPIIDHEMTQKDRNGNLLHINLTLSPIRDIGGKVVAFASVMRDITERKRTDELLRKSEKLAVVGQLAAGVAHEIRNPLTAIKGFLQLLQSRSKEDEVRYYDMMLTEIERMNDIVTEFIRLAKPTRTPFEEKDICKVIKSIVSFLETQAILNNVRFRIEIGHSVQNILCDENQMKQVFVNLIKNAIEAMPNGGTLITTIMNNEETVTIRLTDQGCGIPADRVAKLGEPFYSTKENGTGLGLMMCYKIIEAHHGSMQIRSEPNKGTTVEIKLPCAPIGQH